MGKHYEVNIEPFLYFMLDCFNYRTIKPYKKQYVEITQKENYLKLPRNVRKKLYTKQTSGWYKTLEKLKGMGYLDKFENPRQGTKYSYKIIKSKIISDIYKKIILPPEQYDTLKNKLEKALNTKEQTTLKLLHKRIENQHNRKSIANFLSEINKDKYKLLYIKLFDKEFVNFLFNEFKKFVEQIYINEISNQLIIEKIDGTYKDKDTGETKGKSKKNYVVETKSPDIGYTELVKGYASSLNGTVQIMDDVRYYMNLNRNNRKILILFDLIKINQLFNQIDNHSLIGYKLNLRTYFKQLMEK